MVTAWLWCLPLSPYHPPSRKKSISIDSVDQSQVKDDAVRFFYNHFHLGVLSVQFSIRTRSVFGNRNKRVCTLSHTRAVEGKSVHLLTGVLMGGEQPHNNKYIPLIVFCLHFSLSPSFVSSRSFLPRSSCPHYLSLVYSITSSPQFLCLPAFSYWFSFIGFHPFHSYFSALMAPCSLPLIRALPPPLFK